VTGAFCDLSVAGCRSQFPGQESLCSVRSPSRKPWSLVSVAGRQLQAIPVQHLEFALSCFCVCVTSPFLVLSLSSTESSLYMII
jgi:hypothetical protein